MMVSRLTLSFANGFIRILWPSAQLLGVGPVTPSLAEARFLGGWAGFLQGVFTVDG